MKKSIIYRGILGFPIGIAVGYVITVMISVYVGDGSFYPVAQELIDTMGNELNAVVVQTILSGVMGTGFAVASIIWNIDSWSLAKQSAVYFAAACALTFPIAYIAGWMEHSFFGVLSYVGIFIAIFVIAWVFQYLAWKGSIKKLNNKMKNTNS